MEGKTSVAVIGLGLMARYHLEEMLKVAHTQIEAVCEPSAEAYQTAKGVFLQAGIDTPPNQPDFEKLLAEYGDRLDAVFIITPHNKHHDQAAACLEAGLDVLLEKPMVMNSEEAKSLIETRDRTGRILVVAFQGSLSSRIQMAKSLYSSGKLGELHSINAIVWQNWGKFAQDTWRQEPDIAGGGFLFDTGAHMLNTVRELAGEEIVEVAAWLENKGRSVETISAVIGRLASGALITLHASGETIPSCASDIYAFYSSAILRTGIWGERLEIQYAGQDSFQRVEVPSNPGVWEQFIAVRNGNLENLSPPEIGLRMSRLYEAIRLSSAHNGKPVAIN